MTRSARTSRGQTAANAFATDATSVVVRVLQRAGGPLTAIGVKQALVSDGVPAAAVQGQWPRVQKKIKLHPNVVAESRTYRWISVDPSSQKSAKPAKSTRPAKSTKPAKSAKAAASTEATPGATVESAIEAFELIVRGRLSAARRAALVAVVRAGLRGANTRVSSDDPEEAARRRQREIDAVRALADLATEVEELTTNEAEPAVMIHRVRSRVRRSGLEPIDRAGAETSFDRRRHKPISGSITEGTTVVVVRPGYVWKAPSEDVLIGKAIVVE